MKGFEVYLNLYKKAKKNGYKTEEKWKRILMEYGLSETQVESLV